jgi:branched-chain amino acid transport system permease protein
MVRRLLRGLTVVPAAALLLLSATPVSAAVVTRQAWSATGDFGVVGAEDGKLYAAAAVGMEQARTFVGLDLAGETAESIGAGSLTMVETSGGLSPETAVLNACPFRGALPQDGETTTPPEADCSLSAPLTRDAQGRWTLALSGLASKLVGAGGVAVFPVVTGTATETYTVAFDPGQTAVSVPTPVTPTEPAQTPTDTPTTDPGAASDGGEGVAAPPLVPVDEVPAEPLPETPAAPAPETAPQPVGAVTPAAASGAGAGGPSFLVVLLAGAAVLVLGLLLRDRIQQRQPGASAVARPAQLVTPPLLGYVGLVLLGTSFSGVFALQVGLTCIIFVAAIGLHLLANTTGELSLVHAGLVGLSAFAVAHAADASGVSAFYWIPLGLVVGAALGSIAGIAALRTRGIQVAVVTLSLYIATDRYLFRQEWLVGQSGGVQSPDVSVFGHTFDPASTDYYTSLLPVLVVFVVLAGLVGKLLLASRLGRAFAFVRSSADAASAAGIPVNRYRLIAFGVAGAFAGFAGGLYAFWSSTVAPSAFSLSSPRSSSFFFLVMVVLAGPGGLNGLALSVAFLFGVGEVLGDSVELLTLAGPALLILNLALYRKGLNGALRDTQKIVAARRAVLRRGSPVMDDDRQRVTVSLPSLTVILASAAIVMGFCALALAWYHSGNTDQLWIQNQELISGGLGGMALVVVGSALLVRDALLRGRLVVRAEDLAALTRGAAALEAAPAYSYASGETEVEPEVEPAPARPRRRSSR